MTQSRFAGVDDVRWSAKLPWNSMSRELYELYPALEGLFTFEELRNGFPPPSARSPWTRGPLGKFYCPRDGEEPDEMQALVQLCEAAATQGFVPELLKHLVRLRPQAQKLRDFCNRHVISGDLKLGQEMPES